MNTIQIAPHDGLASIGRVRTQLFGLSTSSFWRLRQEHKNFPKEVSLGPNRRGMFNVAEVLAWIESRKHIAKVKGKAKGSK